MNRKSPAKPICVLAGTHAQYEQWLRDNNLTRRDAVYAADPDRIRGIEFSRIEIVGTFGARKDARELHDFARAYVR